MSMRWREYEAWRKRQRRIAFMKSVASTIISFVAIGLLMLVMLGFMAATPNPSYTSNENAAETK